MDEITPRQGRRRRVLRVVGQFKIHDFQVHAIMAGGNQVAAEFTIEATVPSGKRYRDEEMHLWTFNDDGQGRAPAPLHRHGQAHRRGVKTPIVAAHLWRGRS